MSSPYALESLDKLQVGHIRHFDNLSRQPPNQWELMKGKGYGQEDFGGFRFQLAYMAYALGAVREMVGIERSAFSGNVRVSFHAARSIG